MMSAGEGAVIQSSGRRSLSSCESSLAQGQRSSVGARTRAPARAARRRSESRAPEVEAAAGAAESPEPHWSSQPTNEATQRGSAVAAPSDEPERARRAWETHLASAKWLTERGYRDLLKGRP